MSRLLELGADPAKLYDKFRQQEEERQEQQEDVQLRAQARLTEHIVGGEHVSVRDYRRAREAEDYLMTEPDLDLSDMTYHDYRRMREVEQRGKRPLSYGEYRSLLRAQEPEPEIPQAQNDPTDCDLMAYREEREQEG